MVVAEQASEVSEIEENESEQANHCRPCYTLQTTVIDRATTAVASAGVSQLKMCGSPNNAKNMSML